MLLFSTILEIDQRLTKDDFINLVIGIRKAILKVLYLVLNGTEKETSVLRMKINVWRFKNIETRISLQLDLKRESRMALYGTPIIL